MGPKVRAGRVWWVVSLSFANSSKCYYGNGTDWTWSGNVSENQSLCELHGSPKSHVLATITPRYVIENFGTAVTLPILKLGSIIFALAAANMAVILYIVFLIVLRCPALMPFSSSVPSYWCILFWWYLYSTFNLLPLLTAHRFCGTVSYHRPTSVFLSHLLLECCCLLIDIILWGLVSKSVVSSLKFSILACITCFLRF